MAANVRGLGTTALNTAEIAAQCKRLMVAYNIGQRLFAKYVMNQVLCASHDGCVTTQSEGYPVARIAV